MDATANQVEDRQRLLAMTQGKVFGFGHLPCWMHLANLKMSHMALNSHQRAFRAPLVDTYACFFDDFDHLLTDLATSRLIHSNELIEIHRRADRLKGIHEALWSILGGVRNNSVVELIKASRRSWLELRSLASTAIDDAFDVWRELGDALGNLDVNLALLAIGQRHETPIHEAAYSVVNVAATAYESLPISILQDVVAMIGHLGLTDPGSTIPDTAEKKIGEAIGEIRTQIMCLHKEFRLIIDFREENIAFLGKRLKFSRFRPAERRLLTALAEQRGKPIAVSKLLAKAKLTETSTQAERYLCWLRSKLRPTVELYRLGDAPEPSNVLDLCFILSGRDAGLKTTGVYLLAIEPELVSIIR